MTVGVGFGRDAADEFLADAERAAWRQFNDTAVDYAGFPPRLVPWLRAVAREYPRRPAVAAGGAALTYRELDEQSDAVAGRLHRLGVAPGEVVAVAATRAVEPYPALLGVLKAGAAYLPVDPRDPAERLALLMDDSGARAILADSASAARMGPVAVAGGTRLVVGGGAVPDGWAPLEPAPPPPAEPGGPAGDGLAYVIYTSGTTGRPKGVRVAESSVLNLVYWFIQRHGPRPEDRLAQNAPLTFDPSVQQIFPAWATGACLTVMPEEAMLDARELLGWLRRERVTHLDVVTSHWLHLLDAVVADRELGELPDLRWTIVGGESFSYQHTHQWYRYVRSPGLLNNIYGPTEATVNATEIIVDGGRDAGKVPIGRPLPNYRLYVLDAAGELCPPGVPGDLYIAGAGVAQGYCSTEATAGAWLWHAVLDSRRERLYRTGDVAALVRDAGGDWVLEFRGRADRQIKISGYRVELEEIEVAAKSCPGVRDAAVIGLGDPPEQLGCFAVGETAGIGAIREHLAGKLPAYMVPHVVVPIAAMPFTATGKIDREALLGELERARRRVPDGGAPLSTVEEKIAAVWSEVLSTPVRSPADDFFALGGSSLLALRACAQLREAGVAVHGTDIVRYPVLGTLAAVVAGGAGAGMARSATGSQAPPPPARPGPEPGLRPTPTTRILLDGCAAEGAYPAVVDLRLRGAGRAAVLAAVRDLARRHPLLRVRAVDTPGGPRLVDAGDDMQAQLVDLTAHTPDEAAQIARGIRQGVGRPADPYAVTAGRAVLLAESDGAHRLLLSMSHVLFDGWSVDALRAELIDLLYRGGAGAPAPDGAALDAYLDAMDDWVSWRGADAAVLAHARAFHDAERAAQSRVGHLVRPGRVAVAGATIPKAAGGTEAGMVAAMALAARRVFGLEQVPIARAQHGRRLGTRSFFDVVGNTADLVPLVLPPGEPAATVEAAARALVAGQIDQFHWLAYLRRYDPVLLRDWPRPAHPLAATLRLGYTQNNPVAEESVTLLDGETQSAPSRDGSLEVQVGAGGSGLACAVTGWGLPERTVSHYAVALAGALAELAEDGGRP